MRAELRRMHSPDVPDIRAWSPDQGEPAILVQLMVGPEGQPGEESFEVTLCTAEWLAQRARSEQIVDCRHHVVVGEYGFDDVERYFQRRVAACEGPTWQDVAAKVGRLGRWEFEDYSG
jgi:hypothetical protein